MSSSNSQIVSEGVENLPPVHIAGNLVQKRPSA